MRLVKQSGVNMNMIIKKISNDANYNETMVPYEKNKEAILKTTFESIKKTIEGSNFKTKEEKESYEKRIGEKVKLGEKLTKEEMSYIQRTNPIMYMRIKRIQMNREALENKLKRCRSKKEVEQAYNETISMIHKKDPDKQLLISAYNNVMKEFKNKGEYKALPLDIKDKENKKSKSRKWKQGSNFDISVRRDIITTFDIRV
ncbi:hypothetical protein [Serpentinicella alkaliphila]|uniref:Uncharacterized protein n=1 Tax=Serpentinicella alkaliphila TaxID=1734049 RepID=A0A4R2TT10_9FIRM|nr:hypothetical protein [Serpentinicella alkaliphila]QUH25221.1 hypothetical protein HZR23_05220 [Serpentinicella alkaliphila]TCQ07030.1 hypothetical protein EDD79_100226 [Serpentinicella alkaliphila]